MNVPTYLLAQNVHGPVSPPPTFSLTNVSIQYKTTYNNNEAKNEDEFWKEVNEMTKPNLCV